MITWINKFGGVLFFCICMFSSFLHLSIEGGFASLSKLPLDNEYRLKFVDSVQYEIGLSEIIKIIYPVEILSYRENSGVIEVKTYENSVVYSPIDCVIENKGNNKICLKAGNIMCAVSNIICGVEDQKAIACGDVVGSIIGDSFFVEVFIGSERLSLSDIEAII